MAKIKAPGDWTRVERDAAKAILLEPSPYEADGGELIGRDPRKVTVEEFTSAGIAGTMIGGEGLDVLRAKCLDCCCEQEAEVRKCVAIVCPNWPYRMNANPFRKQNVSDADREARRERGRALAARRHGSRSTPVENTSASSTDDPPGEGSQRPLVETSDDILSPSSSPDDRPGQ
jgi:hypothetical protein